MQATCVTASRRGVAALLGAATLTVAGCGWGVPDQRLFNPPHVVLQDLRLEAPVDGVASIVLDLGIDNPNVDDLILENLSYTVVVNGTLIGQAAEALFVDLPAGDSTEVVAVLPYAESTALAALRLNPPPRGISYLITGELLVTGPGLDRVPYQLEGVRPPP